MAFILVEVRHSCNMWHITASNAVGPIERIVSQEGAVAWVKSTYAPAETMAVQLLVYSPKGLLQEAWAIRGDNARKLDPVLLHESRF